MTAAECQVSGLTHPLGCGTLGPRDLREVITYPRDAIVDTAHVAAALGVSPDLVGKMDLPCFYAGKRPRYVWGLVLDVLTERASLNARPRSG